MGKVYVRSYKTENGMMVACCDKDLIGKTFREGSMKLSLETSFYGDSLLAVEEALILLEAAEILNLVGRDIINSAIERGIVHPDAVISINGVPHAQVMRL